MDPGQPLRPRRDQDWESRKSVIIDLYSCLPLNEMMNIMQEEHLFQATKRQYRRQLSAWGLRRTASKDIKRGSAVYRFLIHGKDMTEGGSRFLKGENIGDSNFELLNAASPPRVNPDLALTLSRSVSASSLVHPAPRKEEDFQVTQSEQSYDQSSTMFEAGVSSNSDETASIASASSAAWISSASSQTSDNETKVAAMDEIAEIFSTDESLHHLFSKFWGKKDYSEVLRNGVTLLKWMGRRLVAAELMNTFPRGGRKGEKEAFRKEKAAKQIILESYFRKLMNQIDDENADSNDSDMEKDEEHMISWNIEVVKDFLRGSDAFLRFKEEFADSVKPFEDKAMWSKLLWNSGERVRFEPPGAVPLLSNVDKVKLAIEQKLGMPVLWWPLKQPRKKVPSSKVRIIWICGCGNETYAEVSCAEAREYRRRCDLRPFDTMAGNGPILPTDNPSLSGSNKLKKLKSATFTLIGKMSQSLQQRPVRNDQVQPSDDDMNGTIATNANPILKRIHWCVDSAEGRTFLHNICIERRKGEDIIDELCKSYRKLRGWKWYFSMTTCAEIKLVQLHRVHEEEEGIVVCSCEGGVLPDLTKFEYSYSKDPPDLEKKIHIRRAETALIDYYHGYPKYRTTERINKYVQGVPHRIKRTELDLEGTGYGLYARQGWTLYRLALFAIITQGWALVFAAVWLWNHPGDLQNAFSPGCYSLGLVTVFVALPDIFTTPERCKLS